MMHRGSYSTRRTNWNWRWFLEYCPSCTNRYNTIIYVLLVIYKSCWWFFFEWLSTTSCKVACVTAALSSCKRKHLTKPSQMPHPNSQELVQFTTGKEEVMTLKGEFHGSAHARILTSLCTLSGTGPGFSLFMNQSWASYLILHANSLKIVNRRINCTVQH